MKPFCDCIDENFNRSTQKKICKRRSENIRKLRVARSSSRHKQNRIAVLDTCPASKVATGFATFPRVAHSAIRNAGTQRKRSNKLFSKLSRQLSGSTGRSTRGYTKPWHVRKTPVGTWKPSSSRTNFSSRLDYVISCTRNYLLNLKRRNFMEYSRIRVSLKNVYPLTNRNWTKFLFLFEVSLLKSSNISTNCHFERWKDARRWSLIVEENVNKENYSASKFVMQARFYVWGPLGVKPLLAYQLSFTCTATMSTYTLS